MELLTEIEQRKKHQLEKISNKANAIVSKNKFDLEENLNTKRELVLQFKEIKEEGTDEDADIKKSLKRAHNREHILLENKVEDKKTNEICVEVLRNISCYSCINKPIIFQLIKELDENEEKYIIKSRNYYIDPTGEKTAILEQRLKEGNEDSKDSLRNKFKERMQNWELNKYGNAGLGYLDIAKKVKDFNITPFIYEFTKQKDGTVKFDLTITIPQKKREKAIDNEILS